MLPPQNSGRNTPLSPASGDVLATTIFYMMLGLITAAGTTGTVWSLLRYAELNDEHTVHYAGQDFYRREAPARRAASARHQPLLTVVARSARDVPLSGGLACCVLYLLLTGDAGFATLARDPAFSGADDLPFFILESEGTKRTSHKLDAPGFLNGPF